VHSVLLQMLKLISDTIEISFHINCNHIRHIQYKNMDRNKWTYCFRYHATQITIVFFNEHSSAPQANKKQKILHIRYRLLS